MATNNALNTPQITLGGTFTMSGAFTFTGTLTANTNVTFPTSGTLATTAGAPTTVVTGTTQAMASNNVYYANNAGLVTLTLPASPVVGDVLVVNGLGAGGWTIAQNSGQLIHFGSAVTTTGVSGSLSSTNQYDSIRLRCAVNTTTFTVEGAPQGNITYV